MSPERVSVGEEGEGHSMLMDRTANRKHVFVATKMILVAAPANNSCVHVITQC